MALFSNKKAPKTTLATSSSDVSWVLKSPRITEKATDASGKGTYVFDVATKANKSQIAQAVAKTYGVTPVKVNVARTPSKTVRNMRTGVYGATSETKKAYVSLKKGETISVM